MPIPMAEPSEGRQSLREIATERIRQAIFDGSFLPGESLNDGELQAWLGFSRTPIREALNDLARVGLVEMAAQRYTRVATPTPEDRTAILQTLGALVGGVVRVTVPRLTEQQRRLAVLSVEGVLTAVQARNTLEHGARVWAMIDLMLTVCPNPYLVRATRDNINSLAFQLSITRTEETTHWADLEEGYPRLLAAFADGDAVAAELAAETVFRL